MRQIQRTWFCRCLVNLDALLLGALEAFWAVLCCKMDTTGPDGLTQQSSLWVLRVRVEFCRAYKSSKEAGPKYLLFNHQPLPLGPVWRAINLNSPLSKNGQLLLK